MAVYVDDMRARYGRMVMCHMIADSPSELDAMATAIGVATKWVQNRGTHREHYDISLGAKRRALALGAVQITQRELAMKCRGRRSE